MFRTKGAIIIIRYEEKTFPYGGAGNTKDAPVPGAPLATSYAYANLHVLILLAISINIVTHHTDTQKLNFSKVTTLPPNRWLLICSYIKRIKEFFI